MGRIQGRIQNRIQGGKKQIGPMPLELMTPIPFGRHPKLRCPMGALEGGISVSFVELKEKCIYAACHFCKEMSLSSVRFKVTQHTA